RKIIEKQEKDLESLKDKVANEVALSIKTGKTESLNNPVSQTRLKELYDDLRCRWPKIKRLLKSNKKTSEVVKESIKVRQHKQSAIQDLQQALYYSRIEGHVSKTYKDVKPEDLMEDLLSECNWLGQLMALNNPPLQPDWKHHMPGMDAWHILPRNFRYFAPDSSHYLC
uniref:Uncharacterized protein n=1 Tax=Poecilia formosa TaxID=48698 RepID=A0A096M8L5_POEFO